ncbi:hypothetical protein UPYG_G00351690 [Umbra pygmaea]|uniref:TAF1C helical bundle domain-containing protein n=1 Tax=Umbra pygmaea TaxID=75934 RepID=A0ABD0VZG7_UMBPY
MPRASRSGDAGKEWYSSGAPSPAGSSDVEGQPWDISQGLEVVVNDSDEDPDQSLATSVALKDTQETPATVFTYPLEKAKSVTPRAEVSSQALLAWEKWLLQIFSKSSEKRSHLPHPTVKTKGLLPRVTDRSNPLEEDCRQSLRKSLTDAMNREEVLVHRNTYLKSLALVPVTAPVEPSEWNDALSQRMTASWEPGLEGWSSWWVERLGLNREDKMAALRRKRRRQKRANAHRRASLSGSFASSVSSLSDIDSDVLSNWSSAASQRTSSDPDYDDASQGACSDTDRVATSALYRKWDALFEPGTPEASPSQEHAGASRFTTTPSQSGSLSRPTTPNKEASGSRLTPLQLLSDSLLRPASARQKLGGSKPTSPSMQFDSSQSLYSDHEQPSTSQEPGMSSQEVGFDESSYGTPLASSQMSCFSTSQRNSRGGLYSQSSQPKRKKSRMGF